MSHKKDDIIWCFTYPTEYPAHGKIIKEFKHNEETYYEFYDEINGGQRITIDSFIVEKPTGRMMSGLAKAREKPRDKK